MMIGIVNGSKALVAIPSTVPAAGACSVSVVDMASMRTPTEAARIAPRRRVAPVRTSSSGVENSRRENPRPMSAPRTWPPIKDRGVAERLEGFTNTIRTLEPRPAARAASERESTIKTDGEYGGGCQSDLD